ncbi:AAA family ATPase [Sunxiuqinia elliptica]|uniref:AAA ATPase-like protein n=1 Tax=Sunxiuqinia elliptica TaxID=655355 RepID=A0A4R6HC87_9BACT|nr:AAA family ATPase [Sunxiuqinia elliptica]TDO05391.1 AAA ATPase-like protein [Sunxiuqinia elliptica]TDO64938.1 AAA ATPase-like protein [Sunxiuqinia elliptica]
MKAKLTKFRVVNFRSIEDSGWIDAENVTCLVGTNESGKTNLLLALWKLNPANEEPIVPLVDYPRKKYHNYSNTNGEEIFIRAEFELEDAIADELSNLTGWHLNLMKDVVVSRKYNGDYDYSFVKNKLLSFQGNDLMSLFEKLISAFLISNLQSKEEKEDLRKIEQFINSEKGKIDEFKSYSQLEIIEIRKVFESFLETSYKRKVNINGFFNDHFFDDISKIIQAFEENGIEVTEGCITTIESSLPTFVYYSDYGNLDSEIYLPHIIDNFNRTDLGEKERAKSRSLKVLFDFVNLSPKQILELGKEALPERIIEYTTDYQGRKTKTNERVEDAKEVNIELERKKKKEREILLQSASTSLTKDFSSWWQQGKYIFRFQADGNHFRIWVSDDKRPDPIELEGRSKGLQWFFSFFLVFLVESKDSHSNCILLLDEPGISLHPVAQMDLIAFFNSLASENQLIYTTHSPFLVSTHNLSGVHAMYVGDSGESVVSNDLRANQKIAEKSIYPIHAAIGITVSDTLLIGCQPVLVEGISDQIYLQQIKKYVLAEGKYKNDKEVVFIPTGGVKGMSPVIRILLGREENLPYVIMDSDKPGIDKIKQLHNQLYSNNKDKVIPVSTFTGEGEFEIEDLMPKDELARLFAKHYRRVNSEDEFDYIYDKNAPIVNQMEAFAKENGYELQNGWKVDIAKDFQRNFDRIISRCGDDIKQLWINLIEKITV